MSTMWVNQAYLDVIYTATIIGCALCLGLFLVVPGFFGLVRESYTYSEGKPLFMYVSKSFPPWAYVLFVLLIGALLSSVFTLSMLTRQSLLPTTLEHIEYIGMLRIMILGILLFFVWRYVWYAIWRYLFIPKARSVLLRQDYWVLNQTCGLLLLPITLLSLTEVPTSALLYAGGGILLVWQLLCVFLAIRRLWDTPESYIYVFLYLCTHEILPWVYIFLLVEDVFLAV